VQVRKGKEERASLALSSRFEGGSLGGLFFEKKRIKKNYVGEDGFPCSGRRTWYRASIKRGEDRTIGRLMLYVGRKGERVGSDYLQRHTNVGKKILRGRDGTLRSR